MNRKTTLLALAVAGVLVLSTGLAANAQAGERGARAQPRGDVQRHTERTRTETGRTRKDIVTGASGRSASRETVIVNDRDAGTRTRDVTWTGPAGRTVTREASLVRDPANGTRTRAATTTFPDGSTRTMDDVVQRTEHGYTRETSIVNRDGGGVTRSVISTRDPATGTWSKDVNVDRKPAPAPAPEQGD